MGNFSIEVFVKGCRNVLTGDQYREQANRELLNTYCTYLQQFNKK